MRARVDAGARSHLLMCLGSASAGGKCWRRRRGGWGVDGYRGGGGWSGDSRSCHRMCMHVQIPLAVPWLMLRTSWIHELGVGEAVLTTQMVMKGAAYAI